MSQKFKPVADEEEMALCRACVQDIINDVNERLRVAQTAALPHSAEFHELVVLGVVESLADSLIQRNPQNAKRLAVLTKAMSDTLEDYRTTAAPLT